MYSMERVSFRLCRYALKDRVICHRAGAPQRKRVDDWDSEYDRGKQKKVKGQGPDEWEDGGNRFQDAWNSRQHGGGRYHKQVDKAVSLQALQCKLSACLASPGHLCAVMSMCCCLSAQPSRPASRPDNALRMSKM